MNAANCGKLQGIAANCRELWRIGDFLLKKNSSAAKLQRISDELHQIAANWGELRQFAVICSESSTI